MPAISCPHCRKAISAPAAAEGRKAKCPHCGKGLVVRARSSPKKPEPARRLARPRSFWLLTTAVLILLGSAIGLFYLPRDSRSAKDIAWAPETKFFPPESPAQKPSENTSDTRPEPKPASADTPSVPLVEQVADLMSRLNAMRKAAKLSAVTVDADLSRGCQAHADYIAANRDHPKLRTAAAFQDEDPALPGYSQDGKKAARASLLAFAEPNTALDLWIGRLNSRPPLLHPNLERIGVAASRSASGEWISVLDATRGHAVVSVAYPAADQKNVPLNFSGGPEAANLVAGFPISLQFSTGHMLAAVDAVLTDERGNRVAVLVSTPEQPLPGVTRPGLIGMIPKQPLAGKSTYHVRIAGQRGERPFVKQWEFATEDDGDESGERATAMLERLNRVRRQAELPPVELDDDLSRGCRLHAKYLALNARHPKVLGMGAHDEHADLPGFTPEGARAGKASDIAMGDQDPIDALEGWMATLYHRVPLLEPKLSKVGFGCARGDKLGWVTVLDVANGRDKGLRPHPVFWPVDGQTDVPLEFPPGGETPNPILDDKSGRAGYPITAFFPHQSPLFKAQATLEDAKGQRVECWFSSPDAPANPKIDKSFQGTTICLIPKEPLRPSGTYRVSLTGEQLGAAWRKSWTFTTAKAGMSPSEAVQRAADRINRARQAAGLPAVRVDVELSRRCQNQADRLASERSAADVKPPGKGDAAPSPAAVGTNAVYLRAPQPTTQIDDLLGTLQRRSFLLEPRLRRIGLGCAFEVGRGWINVLDLNSGQDDGEPIVFPANHQERVPVQGRDRLPDDPKSFAGFPISVWVPGRPTIRNVRATLLEASGKTVDIWLSTPDAPFELGVRQPNVIGIHPRVPLRPGRVYSVNVTADIDGAEWRYGGRFATE
jgi:uncharacterized protein YkwD